MVCCGRPGCRCHADRQLEAGLAGEDHGARHVAGVGRLDDERRTSVDWRGGPGEPSS